MTTYRIQHATARNDKVLVQCRPKTPQGRWKVIGVKVDDDGIALVSQAVWENEINVSQSIGLTSSGFTLLGELDGTPPAQTLQGRAPLDDEVRVGTMETPQGMKTINYREYKEIVEGAKHTRRVLRSTDRPKGWS